MGLDLIVGVVAACPDADDRTNLRKQFAAINKRLAHFGLPPHDENERLRKPYAVQMYGYAGLHYLRRAAAHLYFEGKLPESVVEPADDEDGAVAWESPRVKQWYESLADDADDSPYITYTTRSKAGSRFEHLMMHSDCEGYYVPVPFDRVLPHVKGMSRVAGGELGSSHALMRECEVLAKAMKLPLRLDPESEEVWEAAEDQGRGGRGWRRYGVESFTCLALYRACKFSIKHRAAIVFS